MFTGIVRDTGEITRVQDKNGIRRMLIGTHLDVSKMDIGASIACDGCCLTVVDKEGGCFAVEATNETLSKTTVGDWKEGTKINLEPSLRIGDEMGGHMVTGHVDGVAVLEEVARDGEAHRLVFRVPDHLAQYIAPKGSVALAGISLTVNEVDGSCFSVCIIPHTWEVTSINRWKTGDKVNIEADMMARYVARILGKEEPIEKQDAA
ncbi:MAG: riboflavin synthase [Rhodospirillales bacterium]|nr:riboflavin synthase [Rhodospirillales bacterium]MCB9995946.1 riboflavin synthase [Rhodospirillales bacterium]